MSEKATPRDQDEPAMDCGSSLHSGAVLDHHVIASSGSYFEWDFRYPRR